MLPFPRNWEWILNAYLKFSAALTKHWQKSFHCERRWIIMQCFNVLNKWILEIWTYICYFLFFIFFVKSTYNCIKPDKISYTLTIKVIEWDRHEKSSQGCYYGFVSIFPNSGAVWGKGTLGTHIFLKVLWYPSNSSPMQLQWLHKFC